MGASSLFNLLPEKKDSRLFPVKEAEILKPPPVKERVAEHKICFSNQNAAVPEGWQPLRKFPGESG